MMRKSVLVFLALFFVLANTTRAGEMKITSDNPLSDARFGRSLAASGNDLIVGADGDGGTGSAYIFMLSSGVWNQIAKLTPSDGSDFDKFGISVSIDGDYAVVGAPVNNGTGAAYVFSRNSGGPNNWGQVAKLTASDAGSGDEFGQEFAVGISGDYIAVGARRHANDSGAVYIFQRPPSGWMDATEDTQLVASNAAAGIRFGLGVALDNNKLLVGAANDSAITGSVYFFYRNTAGAWNERQKIKASSPMANAEFGKTVALDSNYAVIGSPNALQPDSGVAYIFQLGSDTMWSQQTTLLPHDRQNYNRYGNSVAIDSNMVLVGAWEDSSAYGVDAGIAYAFLRSGSTWQELSQFIASNGNAGDRFGISLALNKNYGFFGAPRHDIGAGSNQGTVYLHKIDVFAHISVWLQGPYSASGDTMSTAIHDSIPLNNPYSASPWNYAGGDSMGVVRDSIVDWVLVELRTDTTGATAVDSCVAFLSKSGKIVGLSGSGALPLDVSAGNYYIVVRHRNHLAVMTLNAVTLSSRSLNSYDFTTGLSQYYGADAKLLETGVFGMYTGDASADGQVTSSDFNVFNPAARSAQTGYQLSDWNLDNQVTSSDFNLFNPNARNAATTQVP